MLAICGRSLRWTSIKGWRRSLGIALAALAVWGTPVSGQTAGGGAAPEQGGGNLPLRAALDSAESESAADDSEAAQSSQRSRPTVSQQPANNASPTLLYAAVSVNGSTVTDFTQVVRMPNGRFMVTPQFFTAARLNVPAASLLTFAGSTFLPLDSIPGVRYQFNETQQTLDVSVPAEQFTPSYISAQSHPVFAPTKPSPGFFVNHDIELLGFGHSVQATGAFEAVGFGMGGVLSSSMIVGDMTSSRSVHRLNTQFMREFPERMRVLTVGDALSSGGSWTRQLHYAGVQWASNFSIQPSFVPFALPGLQGQAAEPSTLDLYVNNIRTVSRPVNAGPFTIDNIPTVTSQGNIQMVLTDALGRQQVVTTSYISNPQLLRKGVHDFNYQAGVMRWGIGTSLDSYHTGFAAAAHRFGVSNRFTVGAEGEVAGTSQAAGIDGFWGLLPLGILSGGVAASHSASGVGELSHAELSRRTPKFGFGAGAQFATRSFRQLGLGEIGTPRLQTQAQVSYGIRSNVGVGLAFVQQSYYRSPVNTGSSFRTVSGSLSFRIPRVGYMSWTTNYTPSAKQHFSGFMTLSVPLGVRRSAMLSSSYDGVTPSGTVAVSQSLPMGDGIGYRARYNSNRSSVDAGFDNQNRWGTYTVEAGRDNGGSSYRLAERSSLAFVQNRIVPTRWLNDSFAVVELPRTKGVSVYANNQYITKTDRRGLALVPMVAYDANSVRLDDQDVNVDVNMDLGEHTIVPMSRTGVLVRFKASQNRGMIAILQLPDGKFVPAGAQVQVENTGTIAVAGYDGEVYIENLSLPAALTAQWEGQRCRAEIPFSKALEPFPRIGPFLCNPK